MSGNYGPVKKEHFLTRNTFHKDERLTSRKIIQQLFEKNPAINEHPVLLRWTTITIPAVYPAQVCLGVSSRTFPRAVDRNRIKRLMRESYRHYKKHLYFFLIEENLRCGLMLIYTGKKMPEYNLLNKKIILTLERFMKDVKANSSL